MHHGTRKGCRTAIRALLGLWLAAGCGESESRRFDTGVVAAPSEGLNSLEVWAEAGFETMQTPAGALPEVRAEDGGAGFEEQAAAAGWTTREDWPADGDPQAIPGGRLRFHITEYPATLRSEGKDSHTAFQRMVIRACYEALLEVNPTDLDYQPALASHWKIEPLEDGRQRLWFRLNPEARWQTGHRVTTEDVIASWRLKVDEGLLMLGDAIIYREFEEPVAHSPYILSTISNRSSWRQLMNFSANMMIYPAHLIGGITGKQYMEEYQNKPLPGSGRYLIRLEDVRQGNSFAITRVSNYWDRDNPNKAGQYNFHQVRFVAITDETLAREKTKKGELDLYYVNEAKYWVRELTGEKIPQIERNWLLKRKIHNDNPSGMQGFVFNTREEPFSDLRVRRAVALLMDRQALIDKLFHGEYLHIDSFYPGGIYENPKNPVLRYSPEEAIGLLEAAGYDRLDGDGVRSNAEGRRLEFELMSPESPASERLLTVLQENLAQGGVRMTLKPTTFSTRIKMLNDRKFKVYYGAWTGSLFPDPRSSWHSEFAVGPDTGNHPGVIDARIDSLIARYDITFDAAERVRQMQQIDRLLMDGHYFAHAWYGPYSRLVYWNKYGMPDWVLPRTYDYRDVIRLWWYDPDRHRALRAAIASGETLPPVPTEVAWWAEHAAQEEQR
jgi:microcin C transport system substrate-binding protein